MRCMNPLCPAQLKRALKHFAGREAMDIENLGVSIIDQLVEKGLVKDLADLYRLKQVDLEALELLDVDELGLDDVDRRVLLTIIQKYEGGPVGLSTIAASISEEPDTIMDVVEPYLLQLGFLDRTQQGRIATRLAYEHLKIPYPENGQQQRLL